MNPYVFLVLTLLFFSIACLTFKTHYPSVFQSSPSNINIYSLYKNGTLQSDLTLCNKDKIKLKKMYLDKEYHNIYKFLTQSNAVNGTIHKLFKDTYVIAPCITFLHPKSKNNEICFKKYSNTTKFYYKIYIDFSTGYILVEHPNNKLKKPILNNCSFITARLLLTRKNDIIPILH